MKNILSKMVVWDYFVIVFFVNSIATLIVNSYSDRLENSDVVSSIIHALIIMYGYNYFKNRKPY
jgi:uncharacterized membrane protein YjjP (DUF1212 family)